VEVVTSGVNEMWLEGYEEGKREARADALHPERLRRAAIYVLQLADKDIGPLLGERLRDAILSDDRDYRGEDAATDEAEKEWVKPLPKPDWHLDLDR
jgi:hypothetical protein